MFADPPVADVLNGGGVQMVVSCAAIASGDDEVGLDEDVEVLHDVGAAGVGECVDDLACGVWLLCEEVEYFASHGVGECAPDEIGIGWGGGFFEQVHHVTI